MIANILYNEIPVKHIVDSIAWFKQVLSLELVWHSEEEGVAQLNLPSGQMIFLVESQDDTNANFTVNGKQHNVVGFQTRNIAALYHHLVRHDVRTEAIADDGEGNAFLHFYDLDGNLFNVQCDTTIRSKLAKQIYEAAHLTGTFLLRSGQTSNDYFDKYLFEANPFLLSRVAQELAGLVPKGTEVLAGLEMGGIPIATALSLRTNIPAAFVRKKAKEYGTCKLAEGANTVGKRTCIIEDVITTGGQVVLSADELRAGGAIVTDALCVIERNPEGRKKLEEIGLRVHSLFTMQELAAAAGGS